jgi:hypothetical protein
MLVKAYGKELDITIDPSEVQGFRLNAQEYTEGGWKTIEGFEWQTLRLMQTPFETLIDLACELWGQPEFGETLAEELKVPLRYFEED